MRATRTMAGLFVGGASRRMGGAPKGRLVAPATGEPLVVAAARVVRALGLGLVVVGDAAAYADLLDGVPVLGDVPPGIGPLGGLAALLDHAASVGAPYAVALACDLPHLAEARGIALLGRLVAAAPSSASVLAPRRHADAPWEPLFARYDVARAQPGASDAIARGVRSFQRLFTELEVELFELAPDEHVVLDDWDTPADVARDRVR